MRSITRCLKNSARGPETGSEAGYARRRLGDRTVNGKDPQKEAGVNR